MASATVEGRNFSLSNDEKLQWARDIRRSQRERDEATGRHRALLKRAKSEGIDLDAMKRAIKALRIEPDEVVTSTRNEIHYMQLLGIGGITSDSIFVGDIEITERTQQEEDLWEADDRGYRAGRNGTRSDECPYDGGTEAHAVWTKSWRKGQASMAVEMGPNAKIASAQREHPGRTEEDTRESLPAVISPQAKPGKPPRRGRSAAAANGEKPARRRAKAEISEVSPVH
jgi:ribosome modulation factor